MSQTPNPHVSTAAAPGAGSANAQALAAAQRTGITLPGLPEAVTTFEDAYLVQNHFVRALGGVGGWKVSPLRPGGPPRCSPVPAAFIRAPSDTLSDMPAGGWLAEVEIGFILGSDLVPAADTVTRDAVAKAIGTVHSAIEIVTGRMAAGMEAPELERAADLQSCGGIHLGIGITDWHNLDFSVEIAEISGANPVIRATIPQPATDPTLDAIAWLAVHAAGRGMPLLAGQTIITGARLGPLVLPAGSDLVVRVGTLGDILVSRPATAGS